MTYRVLVIPCGISFDVQTNETILEAALRCGYFFPHRCRMGSCGTCRGKVLEGEIEYVRQDILGLTLDECTNGDVLFCSVKPLSDLVIFVKDFNQNTKNSKGPKEWIYNIISSELISKDVTRIMLHPSSEAHLLYQAGQYIKVIHSDGFVSPLSIANAPQDNFLIELQLTHSFDNLQAQDILRVISDEKKLVLRGPYGSCTAGELYSGQPIIFLARGTGFAPVKALIEEMMKFKKMPRMHFYWSVTSPDDFYMDGLLAQWVREFENFSFTPVLSRQNSQWQGRVGLLQDVVLENYVDMAGYKVYVSAPEPIVHDVLHALLGAGVERECFYSDVFDYDGEE